MRNAMIFMCFFFAAAIATAQEKGDKLKKMKTELELTDAQTEKLQNRRDSYKEVLGDATLTREEKKKKIVEMRSTEEQILTQDQLEKMKMKKSERTAEKMLHRHDRKELRTELKSLRAEFDKQITVDDRKALLKIKESMKMRKMDNEGKGRRVNKEELKELGTLSKKYEKQVRTFLKEKGVTDMRVQKRQHKAARVDAKKVGPRKGRKGNRVKKFLLMDF